MYGFRPWIGKNYQQSRWGKRVLVLGESHYQWDKKKPIDNWPTLTVECVEGQIALGTLPGGTPPSDSGLG